MIRYQQVTERTYRVRRNGVGIGFVAEPEHGRSGWFFTSTTNTHDALSEFARQYSRSPYRTRTEATNALLSALGFVDTVATPNRAARRSSGQRGRGRAFGVEMELTGPAPQLIIEALRAHGISVRDRSSSYVQTSGSQWELKHDGSVSGYGLELVSPKLRGEAGLRELETVCRALNEAGATINRSCGLHVHHDFRNLSAEQIKRQVLAFVERQTLVSQMVAPSRRSNGYCPSWELSHRQTLEAFSDSFRSLRDIAYIGPRGVINLQAYARHGSVEIRAHGGTTNFRKIAAWVRFGQALFAAAEAQVQLPTDTVDNLLAVLRNYGLTVEDSATLMRFSRIGETRSQVEASLREAQELLEEVS